MPRAGQTDRPILERDGRILPQHFETRRCAVLTLGVNDETQHHGCAQQALQPVGVGSRLFYEMAETRGPLREPIRNGKGR